MPKAEKVRFGRRSARRCSAEPNSAPSLALQARVDDALRRDNARIALSRATPGWASLTDEQRRLMLTRVIERNILLESDPSHHDAYMATCVRAVYSMAAALAEREVADSGALSQAQSCEGKTPE